MSSTLTSTLLAAVNGLLSFAIAIALIAIAATLVRKARPSAAAAFIVCGVLLAVTPPLSWFVNGIVLGAIGHTSSVYAIVNVVWMIVRFAQWVLVLVGIVQLAKPEGPADPTRY